jgi:hypothetical protein
MKFVDIDPVEEVRRKRELLLEMYGGRRTPQAHGRGTPKLEKQGRKFLSEEAMDAPRNRRDKD